MPDIARRLSGGDRRSIGIADAIAREAIKDPSLVAALVVAMTSPEPVIRMRSADALEKASRDRPEYLQPYRDTLLALLGASQPKEVLWHILQMAPRIQWTARHESILFRAVEKCLGNDSSIVKTCAMQALVDLTLQYPQNLNRVVALVMELSTTGTPAMRSRGKRLLHAMQRMKA